MGALIFYGVVYFIGHQAASLLGRAGGCSPARVRRIGGMALVICVALGHAHTILNAPLPHGQEDGPAQALILYVVLPVAIVAAAVLYFARQQDGGSDDSSL